MARLSLNKAQLGKEMANLSAYRRFLPSLDLKRKQLMAERAKIEAQQAELSASLSKVVERIGAEIPMLADTQIDLDGLITLKDVRLGTMNVAGQKLPAIESIEVEVAPYGFLHRPHWVDLVVERLKEVVRLRLEVQLADLQIATLNKAITKVTQRVNLFEKVLIPEAQSNIRRINIALGDQERAAVVTSKLAKRKREREEAA